MSMENVIILRSVYGKVNNNYLIQPCPNPKTGRMPDVVKKVNVNGDMILTDAEKNSGMYFIPEDFIKTVVDGTTFDLDNPIDKAEWEAIQYCNWIAKDRSEKDENGDLVIDGNSKRYGIADLYVEHPGEISKTRITKKQLVTKACNYVFEESLEDQRKKIKILGKNMDHAISSDVTDYLIQLAEKDPKRIINLYEDENWKLRLFLADAIERGIIRKSDNLYKYDDRILGGSEDSVILFMRDIQYKKLVDSMKRETYPNLLPQKELQELESEDLLTGTPLIDPNHPVKPITAHKIK